MSDPTPEQMVSAALKRFINFKRDRAKTLRIHANGAFQSNDPVRAYRFLGQADELDIVANELDYQFRTKLDLGEPL